MIVMAVYGLRTYTLALLRRHISHHFVDGYHISHKMVFPFPFDPLPT